jgi:DNA-binding ferritin-like protein
MTSRRASSSSARRGPLDSVSVLTAVIEAETAAIDRDRAIAAVASDAGDWITQDLAIQLIREKQTQRRSLQSYVAELAKS